MIKINMFLLASIMFILPSCTAVMDWQTKYPDSMFEEFLEDQTEEYTGYDLDFSPFTGNENLNLDLPTPIESLVK